MKKKLAAVFVLLCLTAALLPVSRATVTPYFMAVNDALLPFRDDTMPLYRSGLLYVPHKVFTDAGVNAAASVEAERVRLYKGDKKYVDFYTAGVTIDQDGNERNWASAQRIGSIFYVPLDSVCNYFGLTYEIIELDYDVIPYDLIFIIRIKSSAILNGKTFVGMKKAQLQSYYYEYYGIDPNASPPPEPGVSAPSPGENVKPTYKDVSIYLSFYDLSAGSAKRILDSLDALTAPGYRSCFFVSTGDISENPELVRRISGSGHTVGIWLNEGTYEEYLRASALLFEAAKVKTVIVSADGETAEAAITTASRNGLIFWDASQSYDDSESISAEEVTEDIPTEPGSRRNLRFTCSPSTAGILPDVLSFLRVNDYTVARITETAELITS